MGIKALGARAIIECVRLEGNPHAVQEVVSALRWYGLLAEGERLLDYVEERDFVRAGGESYGAVFRVEAAGRSDRTSVRKIYAKAIVTGFGPEASETAVRVQIGRFRLLSSWGIRTPRVYGGGRGTIYLEHVEGIAPETTTGASNRFKTPTGRPCVGCSHPSRLEIVPGRNRRTCGTEESDEGTHPDLSQA